MRKITAGHRQKLLVACSVFFISCLLGMAGRPETRKAYVKKLKNGHYQLMVDGRPYLVKGVCYNPVPIGKSYDYDWWSDPAKPWMTDGKLMKEMGVNTVRLYQVHEDPEKVKRVIRDLFDNYGIRTILGSWLGFWEYPCPLYGDKDFQEKVKKEVVEIVSLYKDEPGLLMWIWGNENNFSCFGRVRPWSNREIEAISDPQLKNCRRAEIYYSFLNQLIRQTHKLDPDHPAALGNGELLGLDFADKYTPDADLVACIIYRGKSFGNLFNSLKNTYDRPVLLSEFGADAYNSYEKKEDQNMQAFYLEAQWQQIYRNIANSPEGAGNCLGGTIFEWSDEWWKHGESQPENWLLHDTESTWSNSSYYLDSKENTQNMNEEWFGIVALSEETEGGLNKRLPRKAYYVIREFWKNPYIGKPKDKIQKPKP